MMRAAVTRQLPPLSPACAAVCAGKKAYERGQYENSVSFLEQAVEKAGKATILGGEAMMWLALAYQVGSSRPGEGGRGGCVAAGGRRWHCCVWVLTHCAVCCLFTQACGREQECIDTYKWLEDNHPVPKVCAGGQHLLRAQQSVKQQRGPNTPVRVCTPLHPNTPVCVRVHPSSAPHPPLCVCAPLLHPSQVKKQAADLRYIMEAPKMELSPEERVTIPLLQTDDSWVKKG